MFLYRLFIGVPRSCYAASLRCAHFFVTLRPYRNLRPEAGELRFHLPPLFARGRDRLAQLVAMAVDVLAEFVLPGGAGRDAEAEIAVPPARLVCELAVPVRR